MQMGRVKNWAEFQHYKDRSPPWIKLHRSLLDDFNFTSLPLASKALAPLLWLLAAETSDGSVCLDAGWLAWRLRVATKDVQSGLSPLIQRGFLIPDNRVLAECLQGASSEGETEREGEGEKKERKRTAPKDPTPEITLPEWVASLDGALPIPGDDPLFAWAEKQKMPADWIALAYAAFEDRYAENGKTYADWRAAFRNHVKRGWLDVWRVDGRTGGYVLTTAGEQYRREVLA